MKTQFCTNLVGAVFVLLISIAPAHASIPDALEAVDITFANGVLLTGEMDWHYGVYGFDGYNFPVPGPTGLYVNGLSLFTINGEPNGETINGLWFDPSSPGSGPVFADIGANIADLPNNLTVSDFFDIADGNTYAGVSGTVSCVSGCGVVPIPATFPLLGCAVLGLAAAAMWRRKVAV